MKRLLGFCVISAVFSGCGGGGTAGPVSSSQAPAPATSPQSPVATPSKMAPYLGTWVGDCQSHSQETIVSTLGSDDTLITSAVLNYFANADCSGSILGTATSSERLTSTYLTTVDATVSLSRSGTTPPASFKADRYTQTIPAHILNLTGTSTIHTNEGTLVCIDFADNSNYCLPPVMEELAHTFNGAAYVSGNDMYILEAKGGSLTYDSHYSRKQ